MRRVRPNQARRRRDRRGIAFVWTLLVVFPLMLFGLGMGVDFTRVIITGRDMATATHAAALAAAYQFEPGAARISPEQALGAAVETMCVAQQVGAVDGTSPGASWTVACPGGGTTSVRVQVDSPTTVRVSVNYRVEDLLLLDYFGYDDVEQTVTRTAAVCDPRDATGPTAGYCVRPTR